MYDQGYSIQQTSDNGYIIAGRKGAVTESVENTPSISVNGDVFIIKINDNGDFEWAQSQLDVLKSSTSKLIANDAMYLSLLISDNLNLDTSSLAMEM